MPVASTSPSVPLGRFADGAVREVEAKVPIRTSVRPVAGARHLYTPADRGRLGEEWSFVPGVGGRSSLLSADGAGGRSPHDREHDPRAGGRVPAGAGRGRA